MPETTANLLEFPADDGLRNALDEILREGARKMLTQAIQEEVDAYLERRNHLVDEKGHRLVVRNGTHPARDLQTPVGSIEVKQPRVRDRRARDERERFSSKILPPYLRKTKSIEELIPWLYLKGVSTGDFSEALQALLGPNAKGLSPTTITRLKQGWAGEYEAWERRSLRGKRYVYLWADGVYFNVRLESPENRKQCVLVVIGATASGTKELVAIQDGYRESDASWRELLVDLKHRGLEEPPQLAVADGALGFWKAIATVFPTTRHQRCWVHKTANVLNKMPKSVQPRAKSALHQIWQAETREDAYEAFDTFVDKYEAKHPRAVKCLVEDQDEMLAFYDFPAQHWIHIRTTNPIESTFATVKHRQKRTKGCGSRQACLSMVFRLAVSAQRRWRSLNGAKLLSDVVAGVKFINGERAA
ncbi:MAG: IS256 family transposase [Acidobacteriota bacterium]